MVGNSGAMRARVALVTASALSLPSCTKGSTVEAGANITVTVPAIRSVTACALPL